MFLGFLLKTPYLKELGGMDFMAEWDGAGLNIGLNVPITEYYKVSIGLSHFENLADFATQSNDTVPLQLAVDAPSITASFSIGIPGKIFNSKIK